jgi:flavin-binding protein dodecin
MTDRTYRVTEIVGTSKDGVDQAIKNAISRAGETLRHLDWFEVTQIRGHVVDNQIDHYQVGLKVGFRLEDA